MDERELEIGSGYPLGELARSLATAADHADADTRERAQGRIERWTKVLRGMASGRLSIGSRTPVAGMPAWVTPEVVRGGFATGDAAAGGDLTEWERALAERIGAWPRRSDLFAHHLSEAGLAELDAMLTERTYRVRLPEDAALLTVAWLARHGHADEALRLVEALAPFAGDLRFTPEPVAPDPFDQTVVSRATAGEARQTVARKRPNPAVETMREALTVWNPFADELLELWLETVEDGRVAAAFPPGWDERAAALLDRYRTLAAIHVRCTKHRKPKENLAIMRLALAEWRSAGGLEPRRLGLLQHAVDSAVERRGRPGSPEHAALRAAQSENASVPAHHALARVVVARLGSLPPHVGVADPESLLGPLSGLEADTHGLPAGTAIPASIAAIVRRTLAATPEELIEHGVVPSAEVLAELVPRIAGTTVAAAYPDADLRALMAANYEAFRRRRSLLLLDFKSQVRVDELPWVRAVAGQREQSAGSAEGAMAALARLGELAIDAFPATVIPNPLVAELTTLAREAGSDLPLVEELAADIFMGDFSLKFLRAAKLAARLLGGSLYERYYGIDYAAVLAIEDPGGRMSTKSSELGELCFARAGRKRSRFGWGSPAENGLVIEQAQILTTHNLAALTGPFGPGQRMSLDWDALARRCFERAIALAGRLSRAPQPLRKVKDTAYAWRQMVFYAARLDPDGQAGLVTWAEARLREEPEPVRARLAPALSGLAQVVGGAEFDSEGRLGDGRRLLGWTTGEHWMLARAPAGGRA